MSESASGAAGHRNPRPPDAVTSPPKGGVNNKYEARLQSTEPPPDISNCWMLSIMPIWIEGLVGQPCPTS
jgi:hypothetical protein